VEIFWRLLRRNLNRLSISKRGVSMTKWIDIRIEEEETMITRIEDKGRNMTDLGIIWKEETTEINI
jgi:hypothetical protein